MTMVGSTARPRVQRGDVSEEPRRRLLIAALVAALLPTANAYCAGSADRRCQCELYAYFNMMVCSLEGHQIPLFRSSKRYTTVEILNFKNSLSLTIYPETFKNLTAKIIRIFTLGDITVKPRAFSGVEGKLEDLSIRTKLRTIPDDTFDGLDQLSRLDLSYNRLKTINRTMFAPLSHLEALCFTGNPIEAITDDNFDYLSQLKSLTMDDIRLKTVRRAMFAPMSHLEKLSIGRNQIETIADDTFEGVIQLKLLILSKNRLKTVSRALFAPLSHLEVLWLNGNQIETISEDTFDGVSQLKHLSLGYNRLKTVSGAMFTNLIHLEILTLNANNLDKIPDDTFDDLIQLKVLYISSNNLTTVTHTMFSHLSRLDRLHLDNNPLETIPDDAFLGLCQVDQLIMDKCGLSTLSEPLLSSISHLTVLRLFNNPLVCDCQLAWIQTAAQIIGGVCANPPGAKDQQVVKYDFTHCNRDYTNNTGKGYISKTEV